jgi:hypothetical protein
MKTVEDLITRVRRETRNLTTSGVDAGDSIADAEFVDNLNDAQELCQETIAGVFSTYFETDKIYTIDTTATDYEVLTLPTDILLGTRVSSVEFSYSGDVQDYANLRPVNIRERYSNTGGAFERHPDGYIRRSNQLIITPVPSQNSSKVRLVYERKVLRLDIAKIPAFSTFSRSSTTLTLAWTAANANSDVDDWDVGDTINVLDSRTNTMVVQDGAITAIDSSAGTATVDLTDATYTAATVDALAAANAEGLEGGRTNLSELPDSCEKYLTAYAKLLILERDASLKIAQAAEKQLRVTYRKTGTGLLFPRRIINEGT